MVTLMSCLLRVAVVVLSGLAILVVVVLRQRQQWLLATPVDDLPFGSKPAAHANSLYGRAGDLAYRSC